MSKPNLIDTSTTKRSDTETSSESFKTDTKTDMLFQYLANEDKMVEEGKRQFFNDKVTESDSSSSSSSSRSSRSSKSSKSKKSDRSNRSDKDKHEYKGPEPKGSAFGPSFGNGKSYQEKEKSTEKEMTKEDIELKKLEMLRKLGELSQQGIKLSQNYNMESDLKSMEYEYQLHRSIKSKKMGIEWMSNFMILMVNGLEVFNEKYDPFSLKLTGWGDQTKRDMPEYFDVFGELYEKWAGSGKGMSPEMKLLFMIVMGAGKFHLMNSSVSNQSINEQLDSDPGLAEKLRRNAQSDRLKDMTLEQQQKLHEYMNKQHDEALRKSTDINNLKRMKKEYELKQQITAKQNELNEMRRQLSDNSVDYQPQMPTVRPVAFPPEMMMNRQFEAERQAQIEEQKRRMLQQELANNDLRSVGTHVTLSPQLQSLLKSQGQSFIKSSDSESTGSFIETLTDGKNNVIKRGRPKKTQSVKSVKVKTG